MTELHRYFSDYLDHQRSLRRSRNSLQFSKHAISTFVHFLTTVQAITDPRRITPAHLHAYQRHLADRRTAKGLPLKPSTINGLISGARNFLTYLHTHGLTTRLLTHHLIHVKLPSVLPTSVLTHRQIRRLISIIDTSTPSGIRDRAVIELLYSTAIRIGELERLQLQDADLTNAILTVTGKGDKQRLVPIGRTALRHLTSYIQGARPFLALPQSRPSQHIFLNTKGRPLTGYRIRAILHRYADAAGLDPNVTPHTFRRSCTTEMVRADANLYHVKQLLGHETLGTLKHYAKLNINDLKKTHAKCHPREKDQL